MSERNYWLDLFTAKTWREFLAARAIPGVAEHRDQHPRRVVGDLAERVPGDGGGELGGGEDRDPGRDAETRAHRLLDAGSGDAPHRAGRGEDDVAAVEEGADVTVAEVVDQRAQVRHRDPLRATDIDAADQRNSD